MLMVLFLSSIAYSLAKKKTTTRTKIKKYGKKDKTRTIPFQLLSGLLAKYKKK